MKRFRAPRRTALLCLVLLAALPVLAQDVARSELESVRDRNIVFLNYEGPHAVVDSLDAIRELGLGLGRAIRGGSARAGLESRYAIIHAVDPSVPEGFDADILVLGADARVDHVRNLRHIIAGYLEGAYGYSRSDALLLAGFVTVYNAVYRGDLETFKARYKVVVTRELSAGNAGLSTRYDEWPGRSRIVIPLSRAVAAGRVGANGLGAVASGAVSDKPVVESLRETPDKAIEERRDLVDLKERELEAEKAAIAEEKAAIAEEEKAIAADEKAVVGAAGADQEASLSRSDADKAAVTTESGSVAERKDEVAERKDEVVVREADATAKEAEIVADRASIAEDQKAAIAAEVAAASVPQVRTVLAFRLVDPNGPLSELVRIDPVKGSIESRSDMNALRARSAIDTGAVRLVVAGRSSGTGAVRLVAINEETLDAKLEGAFDVHPDSPIWNLAGGFYVVGKDGAAWRLVKFDSATLAPQARSAVSVAPYTAVVEAEGGLLLQDSGGAFLLLKPKDLSLIKELSK